MIFINAWNKWGEGCHLEPDLRSGLRYLEETKAALMQDQALRDPSQGTLALKNARARLLSEVQRIIQIEGISTRVDIANYSPPGPVFQTMSRVIRKSPLIHRLAKRLYRKLAR